MAIRVSQDIGQLSTQRTAVQNRPVPNAAAARARSSGQPARQIDQVNISSPSHLRTEVLNLQRETRSAQENIRTLDQGRNALSGQRKGFEALQGITQAAENEPEGSEAREALNTAARETVQRLNSAPESVNLRRAAALLNTPQASDTTSGEQAPAAPAVSASAFGLDQVDLRTQEGLEAGAKGAQRALEQTAKLDQALAERADRFAKQAQATQAASLDRGSEPLRDREEAQRIAQDLQRQTQRPGVAATLSVAQTNISTAAANYLLRG